MRLTVFAVQRVDNVRSREVHTWQHAGTECMTICSFVEVPTCPLTSHDAAAVLRRISYTLRRDTKRMARKWIKAWGFTLVATLFRGTKASMRLIDQG